MHTLTFKRNADTLTDFIKKEKKALVIPWNSKNRQITQDKFIFEFIKAAYENFFPDTIIDEEKIILQKYQGIQIGANLKEYWNSDEFREFQKERIRSPILNVNKSIPSGLAERPIKINKQFAYKIARTNTSMSKNDKNNYSLDLYQIVTPGFIKTTAKTSIQRNGFALFSKAPIFYVDARIHYPFNDFKFSSSKESTSSENVFDEISQDEISRLGPSKYALTYARWQHTEAKIEIPSFQDLGLKLYLL